MGIRDMPECIEDCLLESERKFVRARAVYFHLYVLLHTIEASQVLPDKEHRHQVKLMRKRIHRATMSVVRRKIRMTRERMETGIHVFKET